MTFIDDATPEKMNAASEYAGRIFKAFNGGEIALVAGRVYQNSPALWLYDIEIKNFQPYLTIEPYFYSTYVAGGYGNFAIKSFLLKAEYSLTKNMEIPRNLDTVYELLVDDPGSTVRSASSKLEIVASKILMA